MLADAVVDSECTPFDNDPHAEAVTHTDPRKIRSDVGLFDRRDRVGYVLGRKSPRLGYGRG